MTRRSQKFQVQKSPLTVPNRKRVEELRRLPAKKRIAAIAADLKCIPKEVSDENVFHHKTLLRMWDSARIEAGVVTPMEVQRENSPVTFEEMAKATLVFRPRLRG